MPHLRYLVAAAEHSSFRQAATALNVSQPTLSKRVRELENYLGVSLFMRSATGARLTATGEDFARSAREIITEVDLAISRAKLANRGHVGRLVVGFYTSLSAGPLRDIIFNFAQRCSQFQVDMVEGSRASLLALLGRGNVDILVLLGERVYPDYAYANLWSERILVALCKEHPLASRDFLYWTDLKNEQFLMSCRDPGPEFQDIVLGKLAAPGDRPQIKIIDAHSANVLSVVDSGQGITVVCESYAGCPFSGLVFREVRDGNGPTRLGYIAYWRRENGNPALKQVIALFQRYPLALQM